MRRITQTTTALALGLTAALAMTSGCFAKAHDNGATSGRTVGVSQKNSASNVGGSTVSGITSSSTQRNADAQPGNWGGVASAAGSANGQAGGVAAQGGPNKAK